MSWHQVPTFKRTKDGEIYVNPEKQYLQPFELPIDAPNQVVNLPAGARVGPLPMTARWDGPIEIFYIKASVLNVEPGVYDQVYDIDILIDAPGKRKRLMSRRIPLRAIAGDGSRPYILPESILLPNPQSLDITLFQNGAAAQDVEITFGGIKYFPNSAPNKLREQLYGYAQLRERTYAYFLTTDEPITVTPGGVDIINLMTMPDDADMEIFKLTCAQSLPYPAGQQTFRTRIRDMVTDRAITGAKIIAPNLFGAHINSVTDVGGSGGILPYRFATTLMMRRSTQMELVTDDAGTPLEFTVNPVFGGRKISYGN